MQRSPFVSHLEVLYSSIPNHAKLSSCHVHLAEYSAAVEAAKKANNPKTWKEVRATRGHVS